MLNTAKRRRYWLLAICYLLVTGIFFSFSRAAWITTVVLLSYSVIKSLRIAVGKKLTIVGFLPPMLLVVYGIVLVMWYRPLVIERVLPQNTARLEVKSRVERVEGVREAWELIKQHPVLGVGIGNYTQSVAREVRPNQPLYTYQPVHNVPLLVWVELGIVGLALWAVTLYFTVRRSKPAVLLSCCFAVLLLADHYLWSLPFGILLFWSALGVAQGFSLEKSGLKA